MSETAGLFAVCICFYLTDEECKLQSSTRDAVPCTLVFI